MKIGKIGLLFVFFLMSSFVYAENSCQQEVTLIAGQNIDAGTINVSNDGENLFIKFTTKDGWLLSETHLAIETSLDDIPQTTMGNPKNGKFELKNEHDPAVSEFTYVININESGFSLGDELIIAASADVKKFNDKGRVIAKESAWGEGPRLGKGWAMYFINTLEVCKIWNLPEQASLSIAQFPGSNNNYIDLNLDNIPDGFDIFNGVWNGWCVDSTIFIEAEVTYDINVLSSYDPELSIKCPHCVDDEQWDMVNYILNHKESEATWNEIQAAIWFFTDINPNYQGYFTDISQSMIDDALANGVDFVPKSGQFGAIIMDAGSDVQLTFIELDP